MVKITGYYQLPGQMPQKVDFDELFDKAFMNKYTKYRSFEKFLDGGHFHVHSQKDFEDLPEELMDAYVKRVTRFSSWGEMIDAATDRYAMLEITKGNR